MPNPKRRHTNHRTGNRRNKNWNLSVAGSSKCSNCGALRPGHTVCPDCGFYNGKLVLAKKAKKTKKQTDAGPEEKEES
jgi:large subunit ribosomal protein L32